MAGGRAGGRAGDLARCRHAELGGWVRCGAVAPFRAPLPRRLRLEGTHDSGTHVRRLLH